MADQPNSGTEDLEKLWQQGTGVSAPTSSGPAQPPAPAASGERTFEAPLAAKLARYRVLDTGKRGTIDLRDDVEGSPTEGKIWTGARGSVVELPEHVARAVPAGMLEPAELSSLAAPPVDLEASWASAKPIAPTQASPQDQVADVAGRDQRRGELLAYQARDATDPKKAADALRIAGATGFSPAFALQDDGGLRKAWDEDKVDWHQVVQQSPAVARYLESDPVRFAAARSDVASLTGIEWALTGRLIDSAVGQDEQGQPVRKVEWVPPSWYAALRTGLKEQRLVLAETREAVGLGSPENRALASQLTQESGQDLGGDSILAKGWLGLWKLLPMMGGAAAATALGGPAGAGVFFGYQAFGPSFARRAEQTDEKGEKHPTAARLWALGEAVPQGVVGSIGFGPIVRGLLPGVVEKAGAATIERALAERSVTKALAKAVATYGEHYALGAATVAAQGAVSAAVDQAANATTYGGQVDAGAVPKAAWRGFVTGLEDMLLVSAVGPARDFVRDVGRASASADSATRLEVATKDAAASKLLDNSPEEFEHLVGEMKSGRASTAYVGLDAWDSYWRAREVEPRAMASIVVGDGGAAYGEASATRGELAIPIDRFLGQLSKGGHAQALLEDVRLSLDELTPRQLRAEQERLQTRTSEAVAGAEGEQSPIEREWFTPEELARYDEASKSAHTAAEEELARRIAAGGRRENEEWFRSERERLAREVETELDADPVQRALLFLQKGEMRGGPEMQAAAAMLKDEQGRPLKLDRAEIVERYGKYLAGQLGDRFRGIYAGKSSEGAPVDDVASVLRFDSADDLVYGLKDAVPRAEHLKAETQRRLDDLYGRALLDDPEKLAAAAMDAAHNDAAARKSLLELRALARKLDPEARARPIVDLEVLKRTAERLLSEKTIGAISPAYYLQAERAASRRAFELVREGKLHQAFAEKESQVLDQLLYRAARDLKDELDAGEEVLKGAARAPWRSALGKADPAYRDAHDRILEAVRLAAAPVPGPGIERGGIEELVARAALDAQDLAFDVDGLRELFANPRPWKLLTPAEALNVVDAVKSLRHIANERNEMALLGRRMDRDQVIEEARAAAEKNLPEQPKVPRDPLVGNRLLRNMRLAGQSIDALLLDIQSIAHMLDGGDRDGIFHKLFIDGRLAARDKRNDLTRAYLEQITEKFEKSGLDRKRLYERVDVSKELPLSPELAKTWQDGPVTRANLLMMALNMGNESNRERFLGGFGWRADDVLEALSKHLNAKEWRWVQDVWDSLEGFYPEMARVHEEETGLVPKKIKATPFRATAADGTTVEMAGGYYPAKYDPRPGSMKRTGEKQLAQDVADFFQGNYTRAPSVRASHAKERAEHFQDLVNLNWGNTPGHVSQVIQDIAFRKYVKQTATLLLDNRFANVMVQRLGEERAKVLRPWLQAVANITADTVPEHLRFVDRVFSELKSRAAIAALGWSIPRALGDLTDPAIAVSAGLVSAKHLAIVSAKQMGAWGETRRFVLESSGEVRDRTEHLAQNFRVAMGEMGSASGMTHPVLRGMRETAYWTMELVDRLVTTPTWMARYQQSLAEGRPHERAVRDADDVIRKILPPHDVADKPAILRDRRGLGALLLFYGHANKMFNVFRSSADDLARQWRSEEASAGDKAGAVARFAGTVLAVSIVNGVIAEYLSGRGKEENETGAEWLARKLISALCYPFPFLGSAGDWVAGKVLTGKAKPLSLRQAPALSFAQDMVNRIGKTVEEWQDGEPEAGKVAMETAELLLGVGVGAPTRQAHATLGYWSGIAKREIVPRGPFDFLGGSIYGEQDSERAANPLRDAQDVVSGK